MGNPQNPYPPPDDMDGITFGPPPEGSSPQGPPAQPSAPPTDPGVGSTDYPGGQAWNPDNPNQPVPPPPAKRPWWRRPGLLVRLGIFGVIGITAAAPYLGGAKRDDTGSIQAEGALDAVELRVGDCFNEPEGDEVADVTAVPCTEPHDQEVFHVAELPDGEFPDTEAQREFVGQECLPAFASYVGSDYQESDLDIFTLTPTQGSWEQGDRLVTCSAYTLDGTQLTASVRGAGR